MIRNVTALVFLIAFFKGTIEMMKIVEKENKVDAKIYIIIYGLTVSFAAIAATIGFVVGDV